MKKGLKIFLIVLGVFVFLGIIANLGNDNSTKENAAKNKDVEILMTSNKKGEFGSQIVYVTVKNNSNKLIEYLNADVTFFDKNKKVLGKGIGATTNLPVGEERTIECDALDIPDFDTYNVNIQDYSF